MSPAEALDHLVPTGPLLVPLHGQSSMTGMETQGSSLIFSGFQEQPEQLHSLCVD